MGWLECACVCSTLGTPVAGMFRTLFAPMEEDELDLESDSQCSCSCDSDGLLSEEDHLGSTLAGLLSDDHGSEDEGPGLAAIAEEPEPPPGWALPPGYGAAAAIPSSSLPGSPSKPSPFRRPLAPLNEAGLVGSAAKRPRHWAGQAAAGGEAVPLSKARRTLSEAHWAIPTPVSVLASPPRLLCASPPADSSIPWHASPKDAIRRLTPRTLADLLDGQHAASVARLIVVDARYPYEYLGGHVPGAVNVSGLEAAERFLFSREMLEGTGRAVVVFHCEFSSERAPRMYAPSPPWRPATDRAVGPCTSATSTAPSTPSTTPG